MGSGVCLEYFDALFLYIIYSDGVKKQQRFFITFSFYIFLYRILSEAWRLGGGRLSCFYFAYPPAHRRQNVFVPWFRQLAGLRLGGCGSGLFYFR
jgi:hypothetical protein